MKLKIIIFNMSIFISFSNFLHFTEFPLILQVHQVANVVKNNDNY